MNLLRRRIIPKFRSWRAFLDGRERKTDNYYSFFKLHSLVVGDDGIRRTAGAKKKSEEKEEMIK